MALRAQTTGTFPASSTTTSVTIPATVAGDLLLLLVAQNAGTTAVRGVPSSTGATWVTPAAVTAATNGPPPVGLISGTAAAIYACYAVNVGGGITTVTITWAAASKTGNYSLSQWSGVDTVSPIDATTGTGTAAAASQAASVTQVNAADVVVAAIASITAATPSFNAAGSSPATGWNSLTAPAVNSVNLAAAYQEFAAAAARSAAWQFAPTPGTTTAAVGKVALALKEVAGAPAAAGTKPVVVNEAVQRAAVRCWRRRPSGIVVPRLWVPEGAAV